MIGEKEDTIENILIKRDHSKGMKLSHRKFHKKKVKDVKPAT